MARTWQDGKRFPALLALGLMLLLFLAGCGERREELLSVIQKRGKLIAGVKYDSKPFGYLNGDSQLQGYDIDLIRELAKRLLGDPDAVEFQQVQSSTRVIALNSGSVDVVAATMTITPERDKVIDFSRPYYTAHQAVLVPGRSPAKSLAQLKGKHILFIKGTTSEAQIKQRLPQADYLGFKSSTEALAALKAGKGDAITTDDTILYGFLADNCGFRLLDEQLSDEPYGLGMRQAPEVQGFRKRIDRHIADMERDGTLARLEAKWLLPTHAPHCR